MPYLTLDEINTNPIYQPPIEMLYPKGRVVSTYDKWNKATLYAQIKEYTPKDEVILIVCDQVGETSLNAGRKKKTLKNMIKNTQLLDEPYKMPTQMAPYNMSRLHYNDWLIKYD